MMIRFKMFKISVEQFAMLEEPSFKEEVDINTSLGFDFDLDERNIRIRMGFKFTQFEKMIMLLNTACEFNIHKDDWGEIKNDCKFVYPKYLIDCLLTQVVGTARGVLHCKTEGTPYNPIIIPPINVSQMIEHDIIIEKNN